MIAFEDACLDAPAGVALLAALEARERSDLSWWESPADSSPVAVEAAARVVATMTFGELCRAAVDAADRLVGPWIPDAPLAAAAAFVNAESRRSIAAMIDERFHRELHAPMDPARQQWWTSAPSDNGDPRPGPLFRNFEMTYGSGEFTWAGLWTVTDPPAESHDELVGAWEIHPPPTSRWGLPVDHDVRIHEVHRPADWLALVKTHAADTSTTPGLLRPEWRGVADSLDGVHLSWAGFITTDGNVIPDGEGAYTMLRYWGSERTHWLRDCFGEPVPLDSPALTGRVSGDEGVGGLDDPSRRSRDQKLLDDLLGR